MLKKRNLHDCKELFEQMTHPDVYPFVREKADTYDEYVFINHSYMELEKKGEMISRIILNEEGKPIGTINLFDIYNQTGFLGTWIEKEYHGKGYNQPAKEAFINELFLEHGIETIYLKIRKVNIRSQKALMKLPYVLNVNELKQGVYDYINQNGEIYDLYEIPKELYFYHMEEEYIEEAEA